MSRTGQVLTRGPPTNISIKKLIRKSMHLRDADFLVFGLGPRPGKGYERKMRGDERTMKESNKNLKGEIK